MNHGAWGWLARVGREWSGRLQSSCGSGGERRFLEIGRAEWMNGGVSNCGLGGFRGLGGAKGRVGEFRNGAAIWEGRENRTREGRIVANWQDGVVGTAVGHDSASPFRRTGRFVYDAPLLVKQDCGRALEAEKLDITATRITFVDPSVVKGGIKLLELLPTSIQWRSHLSQNLPRSFSSMTSRNFGIYNVSSERRDGGLEDFMILPKVHARGLAKTVAVPPQMQKPMKLRLYMGSPGVIGEPYKKPLPSLPFLRRWFMKEGWRQRKEYYMGMIKTAYTVAKLRQKTKGYSQQRFYQEASDLYKQINIALAEGERTTLRQLVTEGVFSGMKNELKHRENAWAKVNWEMVGPINKMRTVQGRLIAVDKNNKDNAFVQLTLRILSKQKFAAYDKRGKLIAGDPDKELLVEDYWVFEKPLLLTEAKWRLCGRLTV